MRSSTSRAITNANIECDDINAGVGNIGDIIVLGLGDDAACSTTNLQKIRMPVLRLRTLSSGMRLSIR